MKENSINDREMTQKHINIFKWKTPSHDGIHGFWFKKFTFINDRLALEMNRCIQQMNISLHVPELITKGNTTLSERTEAKEPPPNN